ncbi:MAG TPA: enoyl-CoA hydratase/isomerase family protein [Deltaproteobacteria bacterium]|nr:enoyl-CoA hydratase/isomerase family protein [Deltaproteobacteria bacterium]
MSSPGVTLERRGTIALVVLHRPERKNALNEHLWDCLERVIRDLREQLPRVVVITGAGNEAFCAGFDVNPDNPQVSNLIGAVERHEKGPVEILIRRVRSLTDELVFLPVPVIAAINGLAYGGGAEIATRCDLRVIDPGAVLSFSEVRLGLMPDHGGVVGLTRLVGPARAADLILTARKIDAQEALSLGLANRISAQGKSLEEALHLAQIIACNGPRAVRHALKVIRSTPDLTYREALELETEEAVDLISGGECIHGISAFLTKEKPEFPEPE